MGDDRGNLVVVTIPFFAPGEDCMVKKNNNSVEVQESGDLTVLRIGRSIVQLSRKRLEGEFEEATKKLIRRENRLKSSPVRTVRYSGSIAVLEMLSFDRVPPAKFLANRTIYTKEALKQNSACHTVLLRMGCYVGVFRDLDRYKILKPLRGKDPVTGKNSPLWLQTPYLLLWGSEDAPVSRLPSEVARMSWPDYRERLIVWLHDGGHHKLFNWSRL
jgi:hypothetical protein